jgi:hypothetical protein
MLLPLSESRAPRLKMINEKWHTRAEASRYGVAALEQEGQVDPGLQFVTEALETVISRQYSSFLEQ